MRKSVVTIIGALLLLFAPSGWAQTVAAPAINPDGGNYTTAQTITMSSATSGATIYYTIDGSDPSTSSQVYSRPFTIASTATVKAFSAATGYSNSTISSATYTITPRRRPAFPTKVEISPKGVALRPGSYYQFTATCTYQNGLHDDCGLAGGATWGTSTTTSGYYTATASGLITAAVDPATVMNSGTGQPFNYLSGYITVKAGDLKDRAGIITQSSAPQTSTWFQYIVPQYNAGEFTTNNSLNLPVLSPISAVVGSTVALGSYIDPTSSGNTYGGHAGALLQDICNWSSSDDSIATVDREGHSTAIAPGDAAITCTLPGDAVFGQSSQPGWVSPGNIIHLTIVSGGTSNQTWYVRPNGGSLWDAVSSPNGQCDGLADLDYPGNGTGLHCAVNNIRNLWADNVHYYTTKWAISGGDTVIVRQNPQGYNVGYDSPGYTQPVNGARMPSIPSGSSTQHTRILGENYGNCGSDDLKTKLFLSYGADYAFVVSDSQFVDIACFEITDRAACSVGSNWTHSCGSTDDAGGAAIKQNGFTASVNYSDLFIHGLAGSALRGPTGIGVVGQHLHIRGMPPSGIDMDDGPWGEGNVALAGGFTLTDSIVEFSGCIEEYPIVHNYPFIECRDQQLGQYGDGLGTAAANGDWTFSRDVFRYNYQDGLDLLHSGLNSLLVEESQSYGNIGQTYKIGSGKNVLFRNNIALANCNRLSEPIGDEPPSAILPGVGYCRANDNIALSLDAQGTDYIVGNTIGGYFDTTLDIFCNFESCTGNQAIFQNNLLFGSPSPWTYGNTSPGLFYFDVTAFSRSPHPTPWSTESNNLFYNLRNLPSPLYSGEMNADPLFVSEPNLLMWPHDASNGEASWDGFNFHLSSSSPAKGAGVYSWTLQNDNNGNQRPSPPSIGALE